MKSSDLKIINFKHSPTVYRALTSNASIIGLLGPVGSGKSYGCSAWIMYHAQKQKVQKDGYKRARYAVIRNTAPELKSTTIKTFEAMFPPGPHGRVIYSSPITYRITFPPKGDAPGIDVEIIYLALDNANDVRKLLSLELTGAWCNEARELVKPIIDALGGRISRYPAAEDGGCVDPQIIMDTNAPDDDSWWFADFEHGSGDQIIRLPNGKKINLSMKQYKQPPAVLELKEISGGKFESIEPGYEYIYESDEVIRAAGLTWGLNPEAENLPNLDPGYYHRQLIGSTLDYIRVMVQAKYGFFQTGKPVVPEFNAELQVQDIPLLREEPLKLGIDIGGGTLQPGCVIGQKHPRGNWLIHDELVADDMGVENFAEALANFIHDKYEGMNIESVTLDPAAEKRDELFEHKIVEYLRSKGFPCRTASTNDWRVRRTAIAGPCGKIIDGKPKLLIHPRCKTLISGLKGKWDFKKMAISGQEIFQDRPNKNSYSHVCEGLGYLLLGGGEAQPVKSNRSNAENKKWAGGSFSVGQDFNL